MSNIDLELARQRGNRHSLSGELRERFEQAETGAVRRVRITANPAVAESTGGQHALWMLANLLARQFAVVHEIQIAVARVPLHDGVAHFGKGRDLAETLATTVGLVAGPAVRVSLPGDVQEPADVEACIGAARPASDVPRRFGAVGSGWNVAAGDPGQLPSIVPMDRGALGPYFAACLVAGEVFKLLGGLREGKGRFITSLNLSLWDWAEYPRWEELPAGDWPFGGELPSFYLIGAGAVGQAAAAALTASRQLRGFATVIDGDQIDGEGTNLNRYPLATTRDLGASKATLLGQHLQSTGFGVHTDDRNWPAYAYDPLLPNPRADLAQLEAEYRYRLILSCVDKNPARHAVQNFWPEFIIGASTSDLALAVAGYDMRSPYECLKCANPIEPPGPTIEELTHQLRQLSPLQQEQWACEHGLDQGAVVQHLANPRCGTLGEQEISRFARRGTANDWSVGFVSVAAGTLLGGFAKRCVNGQAVTSSRVFLRLPSW